jgi:hypothetical protein
LRLTKEKASAVIELIGLIAALFGKQRKATLIANAMKELGLKLQDFKAARIKIDTYTDILKSGTAMPEEFGPPTLTDAEWIALDAALELQRQPKRTLRQIIRTGSMEGLD